MQIRASESRRFPPIICPSNHTLSATKSACFIPARVLPEGQFLVLPAKSNCAAIAKAFFKKIIFLGGKGDRRGRKEHGRSHHWTSSNILYMIQHDPMIKGHKIHSASFSP